MWLRGGRRARNVLSVLDQDKGQHLHGGPAHMGGAVRFVWSFFLKGGISRGRRQTPNWLTKKTARFSTVLGVLYIRCGHLREVPCT